MRSAKIKLELDPHLPTRPHTWSNPVVPGDHPDPTIVRVGHTFWASSTSGEWSPQFPLFRSSDLIHWTPSGAIFPNQPTWAEGSFWAPELVHDEVTGRFVCWYVGKKRDGPLCIAVATAEDVAGPYTDHGPLLCQPDGSIDPCFARDEHGEPFLIWKEDGNSQSRPTPIWAQRLTGDLLQLTGPVTQLLVNDQPWEEGVVEGPYILRKRSASGQFRFYMFYAGNSCCGNACKYAEGVARADSLLGPWEKFAGNPIVGANDQWRCPGHGTAVQSTSDPNTPARDYLLYHAYPSGGTIYVGREAILDEIAWSPDEPDGRPGWPSINAGHGPGEPSPAPAINFADDFTTPTPHGSWQWPVNTHPYVSSGDGILTLGIPLYSRLSDQPVESALLAVPRPASLNYSATVALLVPSESQPSLWSGLAVIGDPFNTIGLGLRGNPSGTGYSLMLWERRGATQCVVCEAPAPAAGKLFLRSASGRTEHHLQFSFSTDGVHFHIFGEPYDAYSLPAWDRGLRIGLLLEGPCGSASRFQSFELKAR